MDRRVLCKFLDVYLLFLLIALIYLSKDPIGYFALPIMISSLSYILIKILGFIMRRNPLYYNNDSPLNKSE